MNRYIVESLSMFRQIHVVDANSPEEAFEISKSADDNWSKFLGQVKVDVSESTPEKIKEFVESDETFFNCVSYLDVDGKVNYKFENK